MKYRSKHQPNNERVYELVLSETDVNGLAVFYEKFAGDIFAYRLFRPEDMEEVAE